MFLCRKRLSEKRGKYEAKISKLEQPKVKIPPHENYVQILVVGPKKCGKTCLILAFKEEVFPPTTHFLSRQYFGHITVENETRRTMIWDMDASPELLEARKEGYQEADIVLLCFSVEGATSLTSQTDVWLQEIRNHCPTIPIILVGLKEDLRHDQDTSGLITKEEACLFKLNQHLAGYMEASSFHRTGVEEAFKEACKIARKNELCNKDMWGNRGFRMPTL